MLTTTLMSTFLATMAASSSPADAEAMRPGLCERVECTPMQRTKAKAIAAKMKENSAGHRAQAKALRAALIAELQDPNRSASKVMSLRKQLAMERAALKEDRAEARAAFAKLMTPEQRGKLKRKRSLRTFKQRADRPGKSKGKVRSTSRFKSGPEGNAKTTFKAKRKFKSTSPANGLRRAKKYGRPAVFVQG